MRDAAFSESEFLGYIQLQVGAQVYACPVQAIALARSDGAHEPGGFFVADSGEFGILVDSGAEKSAVEDQIRRGSAEAARHIARKFLN